MIVKLSARAEHDLEEILGSLARRAGPRTAIRMVEKIERRCMSLDQLPERGPRLLPDEFPDLRFFVEKPYLVVYRLREGSVEIAAILYGARDSETLLRDRKDT